jgi:hypothetical protein
MMGVIKFALHMFGWLVTIIFQIVASYLIIFLLSVIFPKVDIASRAGWLTSLFGIWLGYVIGINLLGQIALRWVWSEVHILPVQRLFGTAIGALIPLIIVLPIGFSIPMDGAGIRFYDLVANRWQPILAQVSLFAAILGYYFPGLLKVKRASLIKD